MLIYGKAANNEASRPRKLPWVRILLNNDLSVINADIAEILVDLGGKRN